MTVCNNKLRFPSTFIMHFIIFRMESEWVSKWEIVGESGMRAHYDLLGCMQTAIKYVHVLYNHL